VCVFTGNRTKVTKFHPPLVKQKKKKIKHFMVSVIFLCSKNEQRSYGVRNVI